VWNWLKSKKDAVYIGIVKGKPGGEGKSWKIFFAFKSFK
jgi:hypothetical protein